MDKKEGGISKFSLENFFCLRVPKLFVGENFCAVFQKKSVSEKLYAIIRERGGIKLFGRIFFCLTMPKAFAGEPFCAVSKKICGSYKDYG